jgi:hypothetical protein
MHGNRGSQRDPHPRRNPELHEKPVAHPISFQPLANNHSYPAPLPEIAWETFTTLFSGLIYGQRVNLVEPKRKVSVSFEESEQRPLFFGNLEC